MIWLFVPLILWAVWLAWRVRNVFDPQDDGEALRDEWRWLKVSAKWLAIAVFALFVLREGCYSCEASGSAGAVRAELSYQAARYESSAAFWRVWREAIETAIGIW